MFAYNHNFTNASITGGCFINNYTWPAEFQDNYYYGDYIKQLTARLMVTPTNTLSQALDFGPSLRPVDYIQGLDGDLYYANLDGGAIQRIWYSGRTNGYSITTDRATATGGSTIQLNWTVPSGRPATDWIGIFKIGEPNTGTPRWWQYTGGSATGNATVTVPNESTVAGRSGHIQITATAPAYSLTPSTTSVAAGGALSVSWTAPAGSSSFDWISLYKVGDDNHNYGWWKYTGGATSGTFALTAPTEPGQYEFRYLTNNGYTDVARSATITVNAPSVYTLSASPSAVAPNGRVTVSWTAPAGSSTFDWIGMYAVGADNRQYLAYVYTGGATSGNANFTMPPPTASVSWCCNQSKRTSRNR